MPTPLLEKQADRVNYYLPSSLTLECGQMFLKIDRLWNIDIIFPPLLIPCERILQIHYLLHVTSTCNGALQPRFWDLDDVEKSTELQITLCTVSGIYLRSFLLGLNHVALKLSILNCSPMWTDTQIHLRRVAMYRLYIWCCNLTWIHVMFCFPHTCGPNPKLPPHGKDVNHASHLHSGDLASPSRALSVWWAESMYSTSQPRPLCTRMTET